MSRLTVFMFSRTLDHVTWSNTRLVKTDLVDEVIALKGGAGKDLTILGSGSIVAQLARAGLIDEYTFVVNPIVLGSGRTMFEGLKKQLALKRTTARPFANGNVVPGYEPA